MSDNRVNLNATRVPLCHVFRSIAFNTQLKHRVLVGPSLLQFHSRNAVNCAVLWFVIGSSHKNWGTLGIERVTRNPARTFACFALTFKLHNKIVSATEACEIK